MESITEMDYNNPMYDEILKLISTELLIALIALCHTKKVSFNALMKYLKKSNCMQDLFDNIDFEAIAAKNGVNKSTVYKYNKEYNAGIISLNLKNSFSIIIPNEE
jgi:hypothetical protein